MNQVINPVNDLADITQFRGFRLRSVLLLLLLVIGLGALAVGVLPAVFPNFGASLAGSLAGDEPKAYWYLSRATAFVALVLTWLSMVFGLLLTGKIAKDAPGVPTAFDLHQFTSLLGLAFGLFHALILLGDRYIGYSLAQILLPFSGDAYRPLWVGLGQVGLYASIIVGLSFYMRGLITQSGWRLIHFASFGTFVLAILHGVMSGTDSGTLWASALYWFAASSVIFLSVYRILAKRIL